MIVALTVVGSLLLLYLVLLFGVAWFTLHPLRVPIFLSPGALGLPQESVQFESSDDVHLRGWWIHHDDPEAVVVFSHGFLMNRAEPTPMAKRFYESGCACLLYDFRRHGLSGGRISTVGWAERLDVEAAFQLARQRYPGKKIILWGSSMGAAASALATAHEDCTPDALILDSAYSRLVDANGGWWMTFVGPWITPLLMPSWVIGWMLTRIDPRSVDVAHALSRINLPTLLLHGDLDLIVPLEAAQRNLAASLNGELVVFEGVQHSQPRWLQTNKYDAHIFEFLARHGLISEKT